MRENNIHRHHPRLLLPYGLLSVALLLYSLVAGAQTAGNPIVGSATALSIPSTYPNPSSAVVVDNSISLYDYGAANPYPGFTVSIASGGDPTDALAFTASSLPIGVSGSYNSSTQVLTFTGNASASAYQALLRTVTIQSSAAPSVSKQVTFTAGTSLYYSGTGHYYEYVNSGRVDWTVAKAAAASKSLFGLTGYLATITSSGENNFIRDKLAQNAWIGASDEYSQINTATGTTTYADQSASEGHWYWVTGPEAGQNFSNGNRPAPIAVVTYANWNGSEPNNTSNNEHYGEIYFTTNPKGLWNDLPNNGFADLAGYVVEYGTPTSTLNASFTRAVNYTCSPATSPTVSISPSGSTSFCQGGNVTLAANASTGATLLWSTASTASFIVVNATGNYSVTASFTNGCSANASQTVTVNPLPATPIVTASGPTTFCSGSSVTLSTNALTSGTTSYLNRRTPTGSPTTCDCPTGYVAVGYNGRTGSWMDQFSLACKQLNSDGTLGAAVIYTTANGTSTGGGANGPYLFAGNTAMVGLKVDYTNIGDYISGITGYGQSTSYIYGSGANNAGYTTLGTMQGSTTAGNIGTLFVPNGSVVTGMMSYNNDGYSVGVALRYTPIAAINGATLKWSTNATSSSINVSNGGSYTVTITDVNGCAATSAPTTITVNTPPSISGVNNYIQVPTATSSCDAVVNYPGVTVSGTPAPTVTYAFSGATTANGTGTGTGATFNKGLTTVTITAQNSCGTTTTSFNVTVVDNTPPVVACKPATIYLDANGQATLVAAQIDDGSHDNCGPVGLSLVNQGTICGIAAENNSLVLQAPPGAVIDQIEFASYGNPTGTCGFFALGSCNSSNSMSVVQNLALGHNSVTISANNATFGDPCVGTIKNLRVRAHYSSSTPNPASFNCSNLGNNNHATLYVSDVSGNVSTCTATITVVDNIDPTITSTPAVNANTDPNSCSASVNVPNVAIHDNCSVAALTWTMSGATIGASPATGINQVGTYTFNRGTTTINYTVKDQSGHTATASTVVTVTDNEGPVIALPLADVTGECSATATAPIAMDNCAGPVTGTTPDPLTYTAQGNYVIHWTFDDGHGNTSTANQNVIVHDNIAPVPNVANLPAITAECNATVTAPTATDNCSGTITGMTNDPLNYTAQGTYTVHWTYNDGNGNTSSQDQTVIVLDNIAPVPDVANLPTVTGECSASVTAPTATDNCAGTITGITSDPTTYTAQGTYVIHWTYNDGHGNITPQNQSVTVHDVTPPAVPTLADITAQCSATATVPITTDNCVSIVTGTTNDPLTYNTQGTHVIHWTFNDGNGNTSTANQNVIIHDITAPTLTTPTSVAACNTPATGNNYSLTSVAGDNCHVASFGWVAKDGNGNTLASGSGGTASANFPVGTNTITWTVTDDANNTTTTSATVKIWPLPTVTVADQSNFCKQNTIYLGYGPTSLTYKAVGSGGTGGYTYNWGSGFTPVDSLVVNAAGTYTVTVKDANGCTASTSKTVVVKDVRCGNNNSKVQVCHNGNNAICISPNAVPAHMSQHGDCLGDCTSTFAKGSATNHFNLEGGTIVVYPNPAHDKINVELKEMGAAYHSYQIMDMNGRLILTKDLSGDVHSDLISIDISNFVPGIYIIRAVTDNGSNITKFTVE